MEDLCHKNDWPFSIINMMSYMVLAPLGKDHLTPFKNIVSLCQAIEIEKIGSYPFMQLHDTHSSLGKKTGCPHFCQSTQKEKNFGGSP